MSGFVEKIGKSTNELIRKDFLKKIVPYIGLVAVAVFFSIVTKGRMLTLRNASVLLNEVFSIALGCTGVIFVMTLGEIDLSLGAVLGFSAMTGAFAAQVDTALILPVCLISGLLVGVISGTLVSKFNMLGFIVTLGISFVLRGVTTVVLNGSKSIPFEMNRFDNNYLKVSVFVIVLLIIFTLFEFTKIGKSTKATGSLPEAARQCGISLVKVKMFAFITSGLMCGLVGFFSLVRSATAASTTGQGFEFNVLLAMAIGGFSLTGGWTSKFRSAIVGSVIMGLIANGMTLWGMGGYLQQLIRGIIFIFAVILSFDRKSVEVIK